MQSWSDNTDVLTLRLLRNNVTNLTQRYSDPEMGTISFLNSTLRDGCSMDPTNPTIFNVGGDERYGGGFWGKLAVRVRYAAYTYS